MNLKHFALQYYKVGSYFGEEEIIAKQKRKFTMKAATDCDLMILSRDHFEKILVKEFPHIYSKITQLALERMERLEI